MKELGSLENKIKLFTFVGGLMANYFLIKSDIRELYTEKHYEIEHLQYQVDEIKADCCDEKSNETGFVYKQPEAILPPKTKIIEHVF